MFTNDTLSHQTILVTGGASGLGLAMAKRFASLGANIGICGRTEATLQNGLKEIRSTASASSKINYAVADVRDYQQVSAMFDELEAKLGKINGLLNNAAGNFYCPSEDLTPNGFKTVVDIVLHGTFNCTHQFGKRLIANGEPGNVLNIVTTYTETGSAFVLPSACAKAGVYALTTSLAFEWAEYGIRVNAIAPGPFPTPGAWERLMPSGDFEEIFRNQHPMKRFGKHEELADLATFLMSDLASYINGECVTIDGGQRLRGGQFNFVTNLMPRAQLKKLFASMRPKK